jgi:hypothetical protein
LDDYILSYVPESQLGDLDSVHKALPEALHMYLELINVHFSGLPFCGLFYDSTSDYVVPNSVAMKNEL